MNARLIAAALAAALLASPALGSGGGSDHGATAAPPSKKKITPSDSYVQLPSLTAAVVKDFQARGVLQVEAGFDIPDDRLRERAEAILPRLRAACAEALRNYAGDQYVYGRVPDATRIADELQQAADEALGEKGAQLMLAMVIVHENR